MDANGSTRRHSRSRSKTPPVAEQPEPEPPTKGARKNRTSSAGSGRTGAITRRGSAATSSVSRFGGRSTCSSPSLLRRMHWYKGHFASSEAIEEAAST
ncbi:hypothetical protein QJS10_CPA02g01555 [Acorus calamus]|uniref:Uncharacterized protein n=1 Tax=Acorus calamus TaxID=4465 RepID=A0AAV9FEY6_ACOCL|nr:hypothetical protein QJS10_CPA02g01555 [Acorus calamus]